MRLVRRVPEAREKLSEGTLTLTSAAKVESFRRHEKLEDSRVLEIVEEASHQNGLNELERFLLSKTENPVALKEKVRQVTPELQEAKLILTPELQALIRRYEELHGKAPLSQILTTVLAAHLKHKDPLQKVAPERRTRLKAPTSSEQVIESAVSKKSQASGEEANESASSEKSQASREELLERVSENEGQALPQSLTASVKRCAIAKQPSRYIEAKVRRRLWFRSQGQCEWRHPITNERCTSRFRLQFDHYPIPFAKGGPSTEKNLRHVCRAHNARHAVEAYGVRRGGS
jgi:hypothetical protein